VDEQGEATVDNTPIAFTADLLRKFDIRERDATKETPMTEDAKKKYDDLPDTSADNNVRISGGRAVALMRGRPLERRLPGSRESSPITVAIRPLSTEELQNIHDHVVNLGDERATEYQSWIEVGMCLKNIHPDLYDEFEEFSRRSTQFSVRECIGEVEFVRVPQQWAEDWYGIAVLLVADRQSRGVCGDREAQYPSQDRCVPQWRRV